MRGEFPRFPDFPAEVRQHIWRIALTDTWSYTSFKRDGRRVKGVGQISSMAAGQACREAREVMKLTHTRVEATWSTRYHQGPMFLAYINFDRHLFITRDLGSDLGLLRSILQHEILTHAQHLLLYAQDHYEQIQTIRAFSRYCPQISNLAVICPWYDRTLMDIPDDIMPWENWSPLFRKSPRELDLAPLLRDIDSGIPNNFYKRAFQQEKNEEAVAAFPKPPRFYMRNRYAVCHIKDPPAFITRNNQGEYFALPSSSHLLQFNNTRV